MRTYNKKTILIDLDGVLNTYDGVYDENYIPPIKNGAYEFIKHISNDYKIKIFTCRKFLLTSKWIIENGLELYIDDVINKKEPAYILIDDRCINFKGNYQELIKDINNFKPWYK